MRVSRAFRADVWKGRPPSVEAFEQVAKLIQPEPPTWLKEHLHRWLPMAAYAVETLRPPRAEMRASLVTVEKAASLLIKALSSTATVEFLDLGADQPLAPGNLQAALVDLRNRAAAASGASALVDSGGRTKAGRGRALPQPAISAQTYCALLIAETWLYFRGVYPPPRNRQAAEAADIYWRLLGAESRAWGHDKLTAWRPHFEEAARDRLADMKDLRAEYQRHLRESARMEALLSEGPTKGRT
jgi:hypothetical protein